MSFTINLFLDGNLARIRPQGFLGEDLFSIYLKAIEGADYIPSRKANLASLDKIPNILIRLRESGFDINVTNELKQALQSRTAQQWNDDQAVLERIDKLDNEIFARQNTRLFNFQKFGARWLSLRNAALLADEQGTGKTIQAIVSLPANAPAIIVCPASLMGNWIEEFALWRPDIKPILLKGRDSFRWPEDGEILITNYHILPDVHDRVGESGRKCNGFLEPEKCSGCKEEVKFLANTVVTQLTGHQKECNGFKEPKRCYGCHSLLKKSKIGTVLIFDEGQKIKGGTANCAIRARALSKGVRENQGRTWVLTGTPMENNPKELWYVMEAAGVASMCFGNWKNFAIAFKGKILDHGQYQWGLPDSDEVAERIKRGCLRRLRSEVLPELPTKRWQEILVEVDRKYLKQCDQFLNQYGGIDHFISLLDRESIPFEKWSAISAALATAKIPALGEIIKEFQDYPDPIVVFSMHRAPIDTIGKLPGWEILTGEVPVNKRQDIVKRFQAGQLKGLACTIQTAGTGFTLTRAHRAIFVDQSPKPTEMQQAEDRLVRIGAKTSAAIFTILKANHVLDRRITEILIKKRKLITASVDAASVADGSEYNTDKEFSEYFDKINKEIKGQNTNLRQAISEEEIRAINKTQYQFIKQSHSKLAFELIQKAELVGLSDGQWALLVRVLGEAERREELRQALPEGFSPHEMHDLHVVEEKKNNKIDDDSDVDVVEENDSTELNGVIDMSTEDPKVSQALIIISDMKDETRNLLFETMGALIDDEFGKEEGQKLLTVLGLIQGMNENQSDNLYNKVQRKFCTDCGRLDSKDHECPDIDED